MNTLTYFMSFSNTKDLERIKKLLQRNMVEYTINSKHLFIIAYPVNKYALGFLDVAEVTEITLHRNHPRIKNAPEKNLAPLPFIN